MIDFGGAANQLAPAAGTVGVPAQRKSPEEQREQVSRKMLKNAVDAARKPEETRRPRKRGRNLDLEA